MGTLEHGQAPTKKPVPRGFHIGYAGFHFLERIDYDGRPCGLEVYQWQPQAELWCRPNEYACGRDLELINYRYVAPCPLPRTEEQKQKLDAIFSDLALRFKSGNSVPVERATISAEQFETLFDFFVRST